MYRFGNAEWRRDSECHPIRLEHDALPKEKPSPGPRVREANGRFMQYNSGTVTAPPTPSLSIFLNCQTLLPVQLSRDVSGHLALGFDAQSGALRLAVNRPDNRAVVNGGERGGTLLDIDPLALPGMDPGISNTIHVQDLNQRKFWDLIVTSDNSLYFFIEVNSEQRKYQKIGSDLR